jgi:hypothetical protein
MVYQSADVSLGYVVFAVDLTLRLLRHVLFVHTEDGSVVVRYHQLISSSTLINWENHISHTDRQGISILSILPYSSTILVFHTRYRRVRAYEALAS